MTNGYATDGHEHRVIACDDEGARREGFVHPHAAPVTIDAA